MVEVVVLAVAAEEGLEEVEAASEVGGVAAVVSEEEDLEEEGLAVAEGVEVLVGEAGGAGGETTNIEGLVLTTCNPTFPNYTIHHLSCQKVRDWLDGISTPFPLAKLAHQMKTWKEFVKVLCSFSISSISTVLMLCKLML